MRFGKIKNWLLIGGEDIILEAAIFLKEKNQDIMFVTGQRNLDYCLRNGITERFLRAAHGTKDDIKSAIENDFSIWLVEHALCCRRWKKCKH